MTRAWLSNLDSHSANFVKKKICAHRNNLIWRKTCSSSVKFSSILKSTGVGYFACITRLPYILKANYENDLEKDMIANRHRRGWPNDKRKHRYLRLEGSVSLQSLATSALLYLWLLASKHSEVTRTNSGRFGSTSRPWYQDLYEHAALECNDSRFCCLFSKIFRTCQWEGNVGVKDECDIICKDCWGLPVLFW